MNETQLIRECRQGNLKAQETLYKYFAPKMMGMCIRYTSDRDKANDLLQDGFVKVFTHLDEYRGEGSFDGWIRQIFIRCALEKIRQDNTPGA